MLPKESTPMIDPLNMAGRVEGGGGFLQIGEERQLAFHPNVLSTRG
jgi:hypothetical protein